MNRRNLTLTTVTFLIIAIIVPPSVVNGSFIEQKDIQETWSISLNEMRQSLERELLTERLADLGLSAEEIELRLNNTTYYEELLNHVNQIQTGSEGYDPAENIWKVGTIILIIIGIWGFFYLYSAY